MQDEMLDIVDDQDQIVGQMSRSDVYAQNKYHFRVVNAFVVNDQGQLWIPRRSKHKKLFPLCLDASMGGHVSAGETYQQAFERELYEELGLQAADFHVALIVQLNPLQHQTSAFMNLYVIKCQSVPDFNTKDFCEYFWLTPHELITKLSNGDQGKGDLIKMVQYLIDNKMLAEF